MIRERGAEFDDARIYRYSLWRNWDEPPVPPGVPPELLALVRPHVLFIMLNPSTADERSDDPTIRRCMDFAARWGYGALSVGNLYAFRAARPSVLRSVADPVGPDNDAVLRRLVARAARVVVAWGARASDERAARVLEAIMAEKGARPQCLGVTRRGMPRHPLYVRRDASLVEYSPWRAVKWFGENETRPASRP